MELNSWGPNTSLEGERKFSPPYVDAPHKLYKALWMKLFESLEAAKR